MPHRGCVIDWDKRKCTVSQENDTIVAHCNFLQITNFYRATACNAIHGIAIAILSVRL